MAYSQPAEAASWTNTVEAPHDSDGVVEGVTDVRTDCEGTFGCWTYAKVEFLPDAQPGTPSWLKQWGFDGGGFIGGDGRHTVRGDYKGCGLYRVVSENYNDIPDNGINIGVGAGGKGVDVSISKDFGGGLKRIKATTTSDSTRICELA
jgi:hypothetical protein